MTKGAYSESVSSHVCSVFFFQAEDGIRDDLVTGVQTCALPILMRRFQLPGEKVSMLVTIITFGFKYSMPYSVDLLFDVRFLPNPHFIEELRPKIGLDPEIVEYLNAQPEYEHFYAKMLDCVTYLLPEYQKEMKG